MKNFMILPIVIPILIGIILLVRKETKKRKTLLWMTGGGLLLTAALVIIALLTAGEETLQLFLLTDTLPILFHLDGMGRVFAVVAVIVLVCAGFFSFEYMKHEEHEKRYYGFYLIVFGVLVGLCFAGNLITFYLFFELLTLSSMPLVLHNGSREAIMAALKYIFFSLCGAYMALFGLYFVYKYSTTLNFTPGGVLDPGLLAGQEGLLVLVAFIMVLGFGVKAGMFPMHAWLPTAHPVAPAPASAILSAMIVKAGVLAIIRVIYYLFGTEFLRGTWMQTVWIILTLITIFMGSMLAYREPVLKKRLAYSTVSQISYILFGLAVMEPTAMTGSMLHVIGHAFIKATLFLCAGAIIYLTGKTRVDELGGIGKQMPVIMWCYTIVSLGLIGIPPTGGFISKWYLAIGALHSGLAVFCWLGPVILLISALLTAGYLLPLTVQGFFPGVDYDDSAPKKKETLLLTIPIVILTVLSVVIGLLPGGIVSYLTQMVEACM